MSGPVDAEVAPPPPGLSSSADLEVMPSRETMVGDLVVRRALPQRSRRTVGAWCFADHMGPAVVAASDGGIGPHPHMGLQTVTWLVAGELLHRDSLGSEQPIRPGQLNVMTAGHGVAHAEEQLSSGELHGIQLWVAQPEHTRHGPPAFEHHPTPPIVEIDGVVATVLVGSFAGVSASVRRDTEHFGAELTLPRGTATLPVRATDEHAVVVLHGAVTLDGIRVEPGNLAVAGTGRDELVVTAHETSRVMLLGGVPFPEPISMWWNFVGRDHDELAAAGADWNDRTERFGRVASGLDIIRAPAPPWAR